MLCLAAGQIASVLIERETETEIAREREGEREFCVFVCVLQSSGTWTADCCSKPYLRATFQVHCHERLLTASLASMSSRFAHPNHLSACSPGQLWRRVWATWSGARSCETLASRACSAYGGRGILQLASPCPLQSAGMPRSLPSPPSSARCVYAQHPLLALVIDWDPCS